MQILGFAGEPKGKRKAEAMSLYTDNSGIYLVVRELSIMMRPFYQKSNKFSFQKRPPIVFCQ